MELYEFADITLVLVSLQYYILTLYCIIQLGIHSQYKKFVKMYRKSVDYAQPAVVHVMQFATFKRKTQQTTELIIENASCNQFSIKKTTNTLMCIMVIAQLLNSARSKNRKANSKIFKDFTIQNVPKSQYNYQHENTLEQLWGILVNNIKSLTNIQDFIVNYIITQFVLLCFGRKTIRNYIQNCNLNQKQVELHGNEPEILSDYNYEIRGNLLNFLALALKIHATVVYKDAGSQLQDNFKQIYGDQNSQCKVEIWDNGPFYKATINLEEEVVKLTSINSWNNIVQTSQRKKQQQSLDTTVDGLSTKQVQSRSANKEIVKCVKCSAKGRTCQCDKTSKKGATPRQIVVNLNSGRSIFDNIGISNGPKRQSSTHQINSSKS